VARSVVFGIYYYPLRSEYESLNLVKLLAGVIL